MSTGQEMKREPSASSSATTVWGGGYSGKSPRRNVVQDRTVAAPLSGDHAKSSDRQRSQVGPGGQQNFPHAKHCCRRSSRSRVKAQNCSA